MGVVHHCTPPICIDRKANHSFGTICARYKLKVKIVVQCTLLFPVVFLQIKIPKPGGCSITFIDP